MSTFSFVANLLGVLGVLGTFVSALYAGWQSYKTRQEARQDRERQDQRVTIVLKDRERGHEYVLPASLRRRHLTRAELMGHLGMVQKNHKGRFELAYLATHPFFEALERHQEGEGPADFVLPAASGEIAQFRVEEERPAGSAPAEDPGAKADEAEVALQSRPSGRSAAATSA